LKEGGRASKLGVESSGALTDDLEQHETLAIVKATPATARTIDLVILIIS